MPVEAAIAAVAFVALFVVWVVLPNRIRKLHASKEEISTNREN